MVRQAQSCLSANDPVADVVKAAEMQQRLAMSDDTICEVGINDEGGLYVRPSSATFEFIYRAAMEVNWDQDNRCLFGPKPRAWTYVDWFKLIVAAAGDEYGIELRLTPQTTWSNVSDTIRAEIISSVAT